MAQRSVKSATTQQGAEGKQVSLDRALPKFLAWKAAEDEANKAKARADALKEEFRATMRTLGAASGTIAGVQVLRYTATENFRGADFRKGRPDLAEQYTRQQMVDVLDVEALKREQPAVYAEFQSRQLKPDWKALDTAAALKADQR